MIPSKILLTCAMAASLSGCYAYAGPPRHTHYRHERVVVVHERPRPRPVVVAHERPRPVVVHERVVVRENRRHPRHHGHDRD
jgi:hypothetical protein